MLNCKLTALRFMSSSNCICSILVAGHQLPQCLVLLVRSNAERLFGVSFLLTKEGLLYLATLVLPGLCVVVQAGSRRCALFPCLSRSPLMCRSAGAACASLHAPLCVHRAGNFLGAARMHLAGFLDSPGTDRNHLRAVCRHGNAKLHTELSPKLAWIVVRC